MLSTLDSLNVGENGVIKKIYGKKDIKHRLLDIGLINDSKIECVMISPLQDPKAYWIKGTLIALRQDDARNIFIEKEVFKNE